MPNCRKSHDLAFQPAVHSVAEWTKWPDNAIKVLCAPAEAGEHNTLVALFVRNLLYGNALRHGACRSENGR